MTIYTVNLVREKLHDQLDPSAIAELCLHVCRHLLNYFAAPYGQLSRERKLLQEFQVTLKVRFGVLERIASQIIRSRHTAVPMIDIRSVITVVSDTDPDGGPDIDTTSIFNMNSFQLSHASHSDLLEFMALLIESSATSFRTLLNDYLEQVPFIDECINLFRESIAGMVPIVNRLQVRPRVDRPKLTSVILRIDVEHQPVEHDYPYAHCHMYMRKD